MVKISRNSKKLGVFLIAISMFVAGYFFVIFDDVGAQSQERSVLKNGVQSKKMDKKCPDFAFIKMGQSLLKIHKNNINHITFNGKTRFIGCGTTSQKPENADSVSISYKNVLNSEEFDGDVGFQFMLHYQPGKHRGLLSQIENELKSKGKKITDLPREDSFYRYVWNEPKNYSYYIADNPALIDFNKDPLVFNPGDPRCGYFSYTSSFQWKQDIRVSIRTTCYPTTGSLPKPDSLDIWIKAFPKILETLNSIELVD